MRMAVVKAVIRPTMKSCRLAISLIPPGPLEMHAKKRRAYECLIALRIAKCVKAEGLVFFSEKVAIQHRRVNSYCFRTYECQEQNGYTICIDLYETCYPLLRGFGIL